MIREFSTTLTSYKQLVVIVWIEIHSIWLSFFFLQNFSKDLYQISSNWCMKPSCLWDKGLPQWWIISSNWYKRPSCLLDKGLPLCKDLTIKIYKIYIHYEKNIFNWCFFSFSKYHAINIMKSWYTFISFLSLNIMKGW